jgi:hypothetical protein
MYLLYPQKGGLSRKIVLDVHLFLGYKYSMAKRGRPKKKNTLDEYIELRLSTDEKQAFRDAAERSGIPLATWARERLRRIASRELESAELPVAFLK